MFWSRSGAFMRRSSQSGEAEYVEWTAAAASRLYEAGRRRLDILHLACARHPLGVPDAGGVDSAELRLAVRVSAGRGEAATRHLLCLRISARALELWIAAAGPAARPTSRSPRRAFPVLDAAPGDLPDGPALVEGGTIVLDSPADAWRI